MIFALWLNIIELPYYDGQLYQVTTYFQALSLDAAFIQFKLHFVFNDKKVDTRTFFS